MQITKGTIQYFDEVMGIFKSARGEMTYLPQLHTHEETKKFVLALLEKGITFIALETEVMGFVCVENGWVEHLYVASHFQGKGVGKELLDKAKRLSSAGLSLWVFEDNRDVIRFYEREGFQLVKKRDKDEQDNEEGLPDRLYKWKA